MIIDKIKFTVRGKKKELIANTKKFVIDGVQCECYDLRDLFETFKILGYDNSCTQSEFFNGLQETGDFVTAIGVATAIGAQDGRLVLVSEKGKMSKNMLQETLEKISMRKKQNQYSCLFTKQTKGVSVDFGSSEGDEGELDYGRTTSFKTPLQTTATRGASANCGVEEFKANCGVEEFKAKLTRAFQKGVVVPLTMFNKAFAAAHGQMFDVKTQTCSLPRHRHKNLKKFLQCFSEVLQVKKFYNDYVVLCASGTDEISRRRLQSFCVPRAHPRFSIYTETLLVNLFPCRVSVLCKDLTTLFELVYHRSFASLLQATGDDALQTFVTGLKSPNLVLSGSSEAPTVLVTPTDNENYSVHCESSVMVEIFQAEQGIFSDDVKYEKAKTNEVDFSEIFGEIPSEFCELVGLAELNLPLCGQKPRKENSFSIKPEKLTNLCKFIYNSINYE